MGRGVHLAATCTMKVDPLAVSPLRTYGYTLARTTNAYSPSPAAHDAMFRDSILPSPPPPPTSRMPHRSSHYTRSAQDAGASAIPKSPPPRVHRQLLVWLQYGHSDS
ncbi:hypothetical protein IG631_05069 [Alternaria alternata]|nr:hypothetical protein IG631_05069 [Alternaria alternata]